MKFFKSQVFIALSVLSINAFSADKMGGSQESKSKNKLATLLEKQSDPQRVAKYKQLSDELYAWHEKESDELMQEFNNRSDKNPSETMKYAEEVQKKLSALDKVYEEKRKKIEAEYSVSVSWDEFLALSK